MSSESIGAMGAGASGTRPRAVADATTLTDPEWLPVGTGWPGLDDLASEHRRLLDARRQAGEELRALDARFAEEDAGHDLALRDSFADGADGALPAVTGSAERAELRKVASDRLQAGNDVLDDFLERAIVELEAKAPEWMAVLDGQAEASAEKRREAQQLVAAAEADELRLRVLRGWINRNANRDVRFADHPFRFLSWAVMARSFRPPPPLDPLDPNRSAFLQAAPFDPESFAAGLNRGTIGVRPEEEA